MIIIRKKIYTNPVFIFVSIWLLVAFLYSLHLISIVKFNFNLLMILLLSLLTPFMAVALLISFSRRNKARHFLVSELEIKRNFLFLLFFIWMVGSIAEIFVSGGVPVFWILSGSDKTYFDFGVPSIHGFLNSMATTIALIYSYLFLITGKRKLIIPVALILLWSILLVSRQLFLVVFLEVFFVFILIKDQADYLLVPLLTSLGFIVAGTWSLFLVRQQFGVSFQWQNWESVKFQLVDGWHVFFSSIAISLYTISTTFILGLFTNNTVVGYFAAADKIVQAVKGLYQPVSQAIFPLIGKKIHEDKQAGLAFIHKTTWVVGTGMFAISVLLFLLVEPIVNLLLGQQYHQSILLLQIMAFLPFIIALSNMFGIQTMLNLGFKQAFSRILVAAAILGVGLSLVLVPIYEGVGAAWTILVVEVFVAVTIFIYLKNRRDSYAY